jgi:hypothetical protein
VPGQREISQSGGQLLVTAIGREVLVKPAQYGIPEAKLNEIVEKGPHWWERFLQNLQPLSHRFASGVL